VPNWVSGETKLEKKANFKNMFRFKLSKHRDHLASDSCILGVKFPGFFP